MSTWVLVREDIVQHSSEHFVFDVLQKDPNLPNKKEPTASAIQLRAVIYLRKFNLAKRPCTGVYPYPEFTQREHLEAGGNFALNVFTDLNLLAHRSGWCARS